MHDTARVGVRKRIGHLLAITQDLVDRQRTVRQAGTQRLPLDQLHSDVGLPLRLADVMDRADVRVIQPGGEPRLADETRPRRCAP